MRKNKAKIRTYYNVFLESGLQYSLEYVVVNTYYKYQTKMAKLGMLKEEHYIYGDCLGLNK